MPAIAKMYDNLASVYDKLMEDMPYGQWAEYLDQIIRKEKLQGKNILDLGSGTGNISILLSEMGYEVTNLDFSNEMLVLAREKYLAKKIRAHFLEMDIRDIDFQEDFEVVISTFDTLNYFTEPEELEGIFEKVFSSLKNGGLFVFDLNTKYKFERILGNEVYTYNTEELVYIWENNYDPAEMILEIDLSFFLRTSGMNYKRFNELHVQRYYSTGEIKTLLKKSGFARVEVFQDLEFKKPVRNGIRNFFVAKK